jgi:transposase
MLLYASLFGVLGATWNGLCPALFTRWQHKAMRSALAPIKHVDGTLKAHLHGLLSYFKHPITHTDSEPLKSSIQALKPVACGFRSF